MLDHHVAEDAPKVLALKALHPYLSVVVLEHGGVEPASGFARLTEFLAMPPRSRDGRSVRVLEEVHWRAGDSEAQALRDEADLSDVSELAGAVRVAESTPSWADDTAEFRDREHSLTLVLRQDDLIAIYGDNSTMRRLQSWLDKPPQPEWRRLPTHVLETALLQGEVKGLWLQGTHRRRSTKPDSKSISGIRLQDALDPANDSSYTMRSVRTVLGESPDRTVFKGRVGTTPAKSSVWSSEPTVNFSHYVRAVVELLALIRNVTARGPTTASSLPVLAREAADWSTVNGAYEVAVLTPDDLQGFVGVDSSSVADSELLQDAIHKVEGDPNSAAFVLDVGLGGVVGGRLGVTPKQSRARVTLDIGLRGTPSDPPRVIPVRDALGSGELLTVYYRSGHAFANGAFYTAPIVPARFSNWHFRDFNGYRIDREKPSATGTQAIHDEIGKHGDRSLFAWVAHEYRDGWLTCDDGSGEVADFVHIANDATLTFIHVKAAHNASPHREVAVVPYEVVVSQAVKNVIYSDPQLLANRLTASGINRPAAWVDGVRVADRSEFLDALALRDASDRTEVVVIQPHVSAATYARVRSASRSTPVSNELLRLYLLERLLTSARSNVVAACDEFRVIGSSV